MGIQGLLVALKPYTVSGNVRDYSGSAVAVDTSSWLHKSVYSIADHYVECLERNNGKPDKRCCHVSATYIGKRCQELLQYAHISKIYLVMDGKRCPLKAATNQERESRRAENLAAARKFRLQGRSDLMYEKYKACIKVNDHLAKAVTTVIEQRFAETNKVEIIWSPYEADAELVQLAADGRAAAIITEDSDVLVYSASSQVSVPILYKLDRNTGACDVISMDWLLDPNYVKPPPPPIAAGAADPNQDTGKAKKSEQSQLQSVLDIFAARQKRSPGWGARLFVQACVLTGCDYAPRQLNGVGLVTAFKHVRNAGLTGSPAALAKVFRHILFSVLPKKNRNAVPDLQAFEELLAQSESVFFYHPVVTASNRVVHLNQCPPTLEQKHAPTLDRFANVSFLGSLVANRHGSSDIIPKPVLQKQAQFFRKRSAKTDNHTTTRKDAVRQPAQQQQPSAFVREASKRQREQRNVYTTSQPMTLADVASSQQQQQRRKPLQPSSPNVPPAAAVMANPYKKEDPREVYARRHREGGMERVNKIVTAQLPATAKSKKKKQLPPRFDQFQYRQQQEEAEDVRFVKRRFPKDGSRAALPSPPKAAVVATNKRSRQREDKRHHSASQRAEAEEDEDGDWTKEVVVDRREDEDAGDWTKEVSGRNRNAANASSLHQDSATKRRRRTNPQEPPPPPQEGMRAVSLHRTFFKRDKPRGVSQPDSLSFSFGRRPVHQESASDDDHRFGTKQPDYEDDESVLEDDDDGNRYMESEPLLSPTKKECESEPLLSPPKKKKAPTPRFDYGQQEDEEEASPNRGLSSYGMFDPNQFQEPRADHHYSGDKEEEPYEDNAAQTSGYFNGQQLPSSSSSTHENLLGRRVTLDAALAAKLDPNHQERPFCFYDGPSPDTRQHQQEENGPADFCNDAYDEEEAEHVAPSVPPPQFHMAPKASTSIGPAKTLRYRFNSSATDAQQPPKAQKKKSFVKQFLHRINRKRNSQSSTSNNNKKPAPLSFSIGGGPRQSSLLSHFSAAPPRGDEESI